MHSHIPVGVRVWSTVFLASIFCAAVLSKMPIVETNTPFLDASFGMIVVWVGAQFCAGLASRLFAPAQEATKILFTLFAVVVTALGVLFLVDVSRLPAASIPVAALLFVVGVVLVALFALLPALGGAYAAQYVRSSVEH